MVRIVNYIQRFTESGDSFYVLELQGGIQMVKSKETNKFYVTAKKATIPSTFDEETCKSIIGTELPGEVVKVETEPYEYTIKETGEVIELSHRYEYQEEERVPSTKVEKSESTINDFVKAEQSSFSVNGVE
ncbi:hypothetical protein NE848_09105 [Gramella jeungdoensis]|uniref:Uncharacterized protein n=1 Tax=Gramella jeungdoensis TaxID=708091 RepID=A0ABT0Z1F5_9FLAO|nr:hypothetical protein [Gramella jeungdoensis]MCM8569537.1 hypothetical protein [Gramella jeungdoensis]